MKHAIATNLEAAIQMGKTFNMFIQFSDQRLTEGFGWAERIFSLTENWPAGRMRAWAIWMYGDLVSVFPEKYKLSHDLLEAGLGMTREFGDKKLVAYYLQSLSTIYWFESNWEQCLKYSEQYLIAANDFGDPQHISWALSSIGMAKHYLGDTQTAFQYFDQSLTLAQQENIRHSAALGLREYGDIVQLSGDTRKAIILYNESAELFKQIKIMGFYNSTLFRLGLAELQIGNITHARDYFNEFLEINLEYKLDRQELYLFGMACIAATLQQNELAATLYGASQSITDHITKSFSDHIHKSIDPLIASVSNYLGDEEFIRLWEEGGKLSKEQAVEQAKQVECP